MNLQTPLLGVILTVGCAGVKGTDVVTASLLLSILGSSLSTIPIIAAVSQIKRNTTVFSDLVGTQYSRETEINSLNSDQPHGENTN